MYKINYFILLTISLLSFLTVSSMNIFSQPNVMIYETVMHQRPPFYEGQMPLKYLEGKQSFGNGIDIVYWHDFGSWKNEFSFSSLLILEFAKASDKNGILLAEVKYKEIDRDKHVILFEEKHYKSDGSVQFCCTSAYSIGGKVKLSESNIRGKKLHEFFFLLPV